jgi:hypothetical protein
MVSLSGPRIGGTKVAVGEHSVELLIHASGVVEAVVTDASDKLVTDAGLSLVAEAKGGGRAEGKLAFSAPRARFHGRCEAKGKGQVELAPGPVELSLDVGGKVSTATLSDAVVLQEPKLGGQLVVVGSYGVELLVKADGEVLAFVRDRAGAEVKADAGLDLNVMASTKGRMEAIALRFDAVRGCFAGRAGAGVELAGGPLELSLKTGGKLAVGRLEKVSLLAAGDARVDARASAAAGARVGADVKAPAVDAKASLGALGAKAAAGAKVDVQAPKVNVQAPSVSVKQTAGTGAQAGGKAKASSGFSIGTK